MTPRAVASRCHLDALVSQVPDHVAFHKPSAAHRVKEQPAGYTALRRAHKCFANLVYSTPFVADVKFHVAKTFGAIDVGNDGT